MSTAADDPADCDTCMAMSRRTALKAGGVALATAGGLASVQPAFAVEGLDLEGEVAPSTRVEGTVTVAEHRRDEMADALGYIDDGGEVATLVDDGAIIEPRDNADDPHNPITLAANRIAADAYSEFPRNQTYTDADDEEQDFTWTSTDYWTIDADLTVAEGSNPGGGGTLIIQPSGIADGNTASLTFDGGSQSADFEAIDAEDRNYLQLVIDINTLSANALVHVILRDTSAGQTVEASIDPNGDTANEDVIADATADALVYQERLGDLPNIDNVDTIHEVEIQVEASGGSLSDDTDLDLELHALGVERPSELEFGTREFTDSDDELDTETVTHPEGTFDITALSTMGSAFDSATIGDLDVDVHFPAYELPEGQVEFRFTDNERSAIYDRQFELVVNWELPVMFDLTYSGLQIVDTQHLTDDQYSTVEYLEDTGEEVTLQDVDDEEYDNWVDQTDQFSSQSDDVVVNSTVVESEWQAVYYDMNVTAGQEDTMTTETAVGGPTGTPGGSIMDFLFSVPGAIISGIVGWFGLRRLGIIGGDR